jgi:hypothetical protein
LGAISFEKDFTHSVCTNFFLFLLLYSLAHFINVVLYLVPMGCPALGIWVAFLKQPDALPGRAPQKNKNNIFFYYF